jgi:uncharacterized protein (DUF885 family)
VPPDGDPNREVAVPDPGYGALQLRLLFSRAAVRLNVQLLEEADGQDVQTVWTDAYRVSRWLVLARLRQDPSLVMTADADPMAASAAAIARAEERLADMFHPPLPSPCTIEAMPEQLAAAGTPPMYSPPARDGSRAGAYLFNTVHPGPAAGWGLEACAFHEGVPGHHAQFARLQLVPELPLLLSGFYVVAHGEGWGLYAEQLADELGLYSDDRQRLGMLGNAAWRAVRRVVDTGLHARGWSRTQALGFALAHTPLPESFMAAEIDRYIAAPGQALGYLVGQRELLRLRAHARARLGAAFDLRDFHAAVLDHGSLALPVLSQVVEAWIASVVRAQQGPTGR